MWNKGNFFLRINSTNNRFDRKLDNFNYFCFINVFINKIWVFTQIFRTFFFVISLTGVIRYLLSILIMFTHSHVDFHEYFFFLRDKFLEIVQKVEHFIIILIYHRFNRLIWSNSMCNLRDCTWNCVSVKPFTRFNIISRCNLSRSVKNMHFGFFMWFFYSKMTVKYFRDKSDFHFKNSDRKVNTESTHDFHSADIMEIINKLYFRWNQTLDIYVFRPGMFLIVSI